ncbi:hypothetical protein TNCV_2628661 [Trichonephila clavipes]|uniref:Uncharacterized protein n=1 Tax=Trichonephila clavipes TaxID=2585209 RepID=A0A8X6SA20_TRICX|nr:hypothetical protein TNCV_2628661 [Trichonephila clavipes]
MHLPQRFCTAQKSSGTSETGYRSKPIWTFDFIDITESLSFQTSLYPWKRKSPMEEDQVRRSGRNMSSVDMLSDLKGKTIHRLVIFSKHRH